MNLAVIVPWGTDHGQRERVWNYCKQRWDNHGSPYIVAPDPLFRQPTENGPRPFSLGRAVNAAVKNASPIYDSFIIFGADHLPDFDAITWAAQRLNGGREWCLPFNRADGLDEVGTDELIAGGSPEWTIGEGRSVLPGIMAFTRRAWNKVGGFDPRYEGWGYEDVDLMNRLHVHVQPMEYVHYENALRCLWHPDGDASQHRGDLTMNNPNVRLFSETWR